MNENLVNESQDIEITYDCGRFVASVKVGMGSDRMVTLPVAVWNYGAIVSALIRSRYSQSEVEAIMRNLLGKKMDAADKFEALTEWCNQCKTRAAYLMNLGEKEYDLVSEEWQERCKATLEKAKKEKLAAILAYDTSSDVNGFMLNGNKVWLDKETRVGLMNSTQITRDMGQDTTTLWFDGYKLEVRCDMAIMLLSSLEMYALECFNVTAAHKKAVSELNTIEEVEAYDYKTGYPKQLDIKL
jgi:hypothetical protein